MRNKKNIFNVNNTYLPIIGTYSPEPRSECPGYDSLIEMNRYSLNLTTLYKTALRIGGLGNLQLDYGDIRGVDQCWESIPGEEVNLPLFVLF